MKKYITLLLFPLVALCQTETQFTAILDGSLTFNRPYWSSQDTFNYSLIELQPNVDGLYDILNPSANLTISNDPYIYLYQDSFDPINPTTNLIAYDDDSGGNLLFQLSGIEFNSVTSYFLVATSYLPSSTGTFDIVVSGVGSVEFGGSVENPTIPEPSTMAFILGVFVILFMFIRKSYIKEIVKKS